MTPAPVAALKPPPAQNGGSLVPSHDALEERMTNAYHSIPELGYQGNRSIESRLDGISVLEGHCDRATVLDLGCAEGVVARALVGYGARLVHGFDVAEERLETAGRLFATLPGQESLTYVFLIGDFSDMARFRNEFAAELRKAYDIVLLLGVMHDAEEAEALDFIRELLPVCGEWILIRGGLNRHRAITALLEGRGYVLRETIYASHDRTGKLRVYSRDSGIE